VDRAQPHQVQSVFDIIVAYVTEKKNLLCQDEIGFHSILGKLTLTEPTQQAVAVM
jgi:hypothetical protein